MLTHWTSTTYQAPSAPVMPQSQRFMQFRYPLPYGAILQEDGVQFVVYSRSATAMRVLLYRERRPTASRIASIEFNPDDRPLGRPVERVRSRARRPGSSTTFRPTGRTPRSAATASIRRRG